MQRKSDILKRDNFVCSQCLCDNFEKPLEVHHITYIQGRKAWEYQDYFLVTLCRDCHQKEHDNQNIYKYGKVIEWIKKLVYPNLIKKVNNKINPNF